MNLMELFSGASMVEILLGILGSVLLAIAGYMSHTLSRLTENVAFMMGRYDEKFNSTEMRLGQLEKDVRDVQRKRQTKLSGAV